MLLTELKPLSFLVSSVCRGVPVGRIARFRVLFPDIGKPHAVEVGVLRYQGEKSIVKPEATQEELELPEGLTIHL